MEMKNDQLNGRRWRTQKGDLQAEEELEEIKRQERKKWREEASPKFSRTRLVANGASEERTQPIFCVKHFTQELTIG